MVVKKGFMLITIPIMIALFVLVIGGAFGLSVLLKKQLIINLIVEYENNEGDLSILSLLRRKFSETLDGYDVIVLSSNIQSDSFLDFIDDAINKTISPKCYELYFLEKLIKKTCDCGRNSNKVSFDLIVPYNDENLIKTLTLVYK